MQKVNIFAQFAKGGTFYKSEMCLSSNTVNEILDSCELSNVGAHVYLDGEYIPLIDRCRTLSALKARNPAFLSVKYGEMKTDLKREKRKTNTPEQDQR